MVTEFSRFLAGLTLLSVALLLFQPDLIWIPLLLVPLIYIGFYDRFQSQHSIWWNYPLFGCGRWFMELLRPYIRQYFMESETNGVLINRMFRSMVYQRTQDELETVPYGTKVDTYKSGYEWMGHSLSAIDVCAVDVLRVEVCGNSWPVVYRLHSTQFRSAGMNFAS